MDSFVHFFQEGLTLFYSLAFNWGTAIVLLTLLTRTLLWPLQMMTHRQQTKLKLMKPELEELKAAYKNDPAVYFRERSFVMKRGGVNSWLSLLAIAIQIPIFTSMYRAISTLTALGASSFIWIPRLGVADPYFVLPLLSATVIWLQTRTSSGEMMGAPKLMSYALPAVSFAFLATMPAGIALYSLTSSVAQLAGQKLTV